MKKNYTLITGGSSGIGLEFARLFASKGHDLILVARNVEKLNKVKEALGTFDVDIVTISQDLSQPGAAQNLYATIEKQDLLVDQLINNAGFGAYDNFLETEPEVTEAMAMLGVVAFTQVARLFAPAMVKRGRGKILNVASTAAFQAGPGAAVYYATNAYELHFSEAIAAELTPHGVTVTCLCPGPTATEFQQKAGIAASPLQLSAERVALEGYQGLMTGKTLVIPGVHNQLGTVLVRLLPRRLVTTILQQVRDKSVELN